MDIPEQHDILSIFAKDLGIDEKTYRRNYRYILYDSKSRAPYLYDSSNNRTSLICIEPLVGTLDDENIYQYIDHNDYVLIAKTYDVEGTTFKWTKEIKNLNADRFFRDMESLADYIRLAEFGSQLIGRLAELMKFK